MNLIWTRENTGNYAPHITRVGGMYYRVRRGMDAGWIVQTSENREEWTVVSEHRTQRDAKASVAQQD